MILGMISCERRPVSPTYITIGTGDITGLYYPVGGAISRILNNKIDSYQIRVAVVSTDGSVYNINSVLRGNLQFGIAQSDRQYQAYYGKKEWKEAGPQKELRSVLSIHFESLTMIATLGSNIRKIQDLIGKKVNLGNLGSGQLENARDVLNAFNIQEKSIDAKYLPALEALKLFHSGQLDAFLYTVGHPNANIMKATSSDIKVRIVPIDGPKIDKLITQYSYYTKSIIPIRFYPGTVQQKDIYSIGVKATLVTSSRVNEKIVYSITKEIFESFDQFKKLHPAYQNLTKIGMLQGLSAPLHKGAIRYYKEANLLHHIDSALIQSI